MPKKGYKQTEEHKKRVTESRKGHKHSEETKRKISESLKGNQLSEETKKKMSESRKGDKHHNWKGGKFISNGYRFIKKPYHPRASKYGYVQEHRLVAEEMLGRYLKPEERVHHIDFNKLNNKSDNLYIFKNSSDHQKVKANLFKLLESLVKIGIIKFNKENGKYQ